MLAVADELFECVWSFCGVGTQRVKGTENSLIDDANNSSELKISSGEADKCRTHLLLSKV